MKEQRKRGRPRKASNAEIIESQKPFHSKLSDFVDKVFDLHREHPHGCFLMQARLNQRNMGAGPAHVLHAQDAANFQSTSAWVQRALSQGSET